MAFPQRDPFSWADQFSTQATQMGQDANRMAQNALLQLFQTEAARQAPYVQLPAELAGANIAGKNKLQQQLALAEGKADIKRRYGGAGKSMTEKNKDNIGTAGGQHLGAVYEQDGNLYQMKEVDGIPIPIYIGPAPKKKAEPTNEEE